MREVCLFVPGKVALSRLNRYNCSIEKMIPRTVDAAGGRPNGRRSAQVVYPYLSSKHNTASDTLRECLMSTSKLQREFSFALSTHFGQFTIRENSRPDWCRGANFERLELDFWIVELDIAVEIQGQQHYVYTPHFHASYEDFKAQQARDEAKKRKCVDYRILLIEVSDRESFNEAISKIHDRANAELALTAKQKASRNFQKKFDVLLQNFRDYLSATDIPDDKLLSRVQILKTRALGFRNLHGVYTIKTLDRESLAEFARLYQAASDLAEHVRARRTVANGFYPGEEILWIHQPGDGDYCYEVKGFVVYASPSWVTFVTVSSSGKRKERKDHRSNIVAADHVLYDKRRAHQRTADAGQEGG